MFLKSIRLKNVKCFSDIALSFEAEGEQTSASGHSYWLKTARAKVRF